MDITLIRQTAINLAKELDGKNSAIDYKTVVSDGCDRVYGLYEDSKHSEIYHWLDTGVTTLQAEEHLRSEVE